MRISANHSILLVLPLAFLSCFSCADATRNEHQATLKRGGSTSLETEPPSSQASISQLNSTTQNASTEPIEEEVQNTEGLKTIGVALGETSASLEGATWPPASWYDPYPALFVEKPVFVRIKLPNGRVLATKTMFLALIRYNDHVTDVTFIPSERVLPLQAVITQTEKFFRQWKCIIITQPSIDSEKRMGNPGTENANPLPGNALISGESKANIWFNISPGWQGWYLRVSLGLTIEEGHHILKLPQP